jgi:predicted RNase H-like HicB family nuclease
MIDYQINVELDDNGTIRITCPQLPEVATFAKTATEVRARASAAIEEALAARIAAGTEVPPPVCSHCSTTEGLQRYRSVPRKEGGDTWEILQCTACHKKTAGGVRSQAQAEELARLAHEMKRAVETLEDAFTGLGDWPDHLLGMMQRLAGIAKNIANQALEWASDNNVDLDPSDLTTFGPTDYKRLDDGN